MPIEPPFSSAHSLVAPFLYFALSSSPPTLCAFFRSRHCRALSVSHAPNLFFTPPVSSPRFFRVWSDTHFPLQQAPFALVPSIHDALFAPSSVPSALAEPWLTSRWFAFVRISAGHISCTLQVIIYSYFSTSSLHPHILLRHSPLPTVLAQPIHSTSPHPISSLRPVSPSARYPPACRPGPSRFVFTAVMASPPPTLPQFPVFHSGCHRPLFAFHPHYLRPTWRRLLARVAQLWSRLFFPRLLLRAAPSPLICHHTKPPTAHHLSVSHSYFTGPFGFHSSLRFPSFRLA